MDKAIKYLKNKLKKNEIIVISVSGGADSMCLLYLLISLKDELNLNIIVSHINHNKRKESKEEFSFVKKYALKHNCLFEGMTIDAYQDDNFHNEARNIRYKFLDEVVDKYDAKYLLTAHHGDDLMETVLMRITRGSTLNGYAGFKQENALNGYQIIRPLIYYSKDEILSFVKEKSIPYRDDWTNKEDMYTRNRYRKNVLPFFKQEEKNVHLKFLKYSETLNSYASYVNKVALKEKNKVFKNNVLDINKWAKLDKLIKVRIIELILEDIYHDDLIYINDVHTQNILELTMNSSNKEINLPHNIIIRKEYNNLLFIDNLEETSYEIELDKVAYLPNNYVLEVVSKSEDKSNFVTRLSSNEVKLPLYVRNRLDGDRMTIKNMNGSKKIKDIFIDNKIALQERKIWPVVLDSENNIIWLPGLKKSKFDKEINEKYDIIIEYRKEEI